MTTPYYTSPDGEVTLYHAEALDVLPTLADASVDAVVCDPPYGLADHHPRVIAEALAAWLGGDRAYVPEGPGGFMGRAWDRFVPPPAVWDECLRVLKPGGHLVAFAAPRTADLMGLSIRLAGFEIRDSLHWIFGSGMPKGQNIGKAIDRHRDDRAQVLQVTAWLAAARDAAGWTNARLDDLFGFNGMAGHWTCQNIAAAVPTPEQWDRLQETLGFDDTGIRPLVAELNGRKGELGEAWARREVIGQGYRVRHESDVMLAPVSAGAYDLTAPATDAARQWHGWNTQLRPAHEPIILARRPLDGTVAANVLRHGVGALNVDGCRTDNPGPHGTRGRKKFEGFEVGDRDVYAGDMATDRKSPENPAGRWPTNVLLTHSPMLDAEGQVIGDACTDGCQPGCAVAEMDRQSGIRRSGGNLSGNEPGTRFTDAYGECKGRTPYVKHLDEGGASRFFPIFRYEAKAPASERPRLADGTAHVSVKPLALMSWLVRLVTPPGGLVLDPFAGTGTTLQAATAEGMRAVGVEQHQPYADLCVIRLAQPVALGLFPAS